MHRGETGRRLPVAGPQGRGHEAEVPGAAPPDRRRGHQTGPQGDAADLRGAEDGREGRRDPAAGGHPGQRLRPLDPLGAGGQAGAAVAGRRGQPPAPAPRHTDLEQLCINTVRALAMDAVQQADSGHPGTAMALAPLAWVFWQKHLRYNPANPDWPDRDRFVLSCGHACVLLYCALYLTGYDLTLEDLKQFRQWGSRTPGHSEHGVTPGVEATTGPLGQGVGDAVGMAIAEAQLGAALAAARRTTERPSLVIVRTHIAFGSPGKQDTAEAHGAPLGADEVKRTKQNLGWPSLEAFFVPAESLTQWRRAQERGARFEADWRKRWDAYRKGHGDLAAELERRLAGRLPDRWDADLPVFTPQDGALATRAASGKVLNVIAPKVPELIGGSADLTGSNNTQLKGSGDFAAGRYRERNFHFGVREHAMAAALNGIALHRGVVPYGATLLIFSDYMRPAIRLAALTHFKPIYLFTNDSIGLREHGPTHQPIEHLAALRAMPNLTVIRPADATEVVEAWRAVILHRQGPVALVLTRQKVPVIDRAKYAPANGLRLGGYVLADAPGGKPDIVLMATGSEVELILAAYEQLKANGQKPRAVSMPCLEYFAAQPQEYRDAVLPPSVPLRIAVEAAAPQSWYRWVGDKGVVLGIERFGASAPYQRIYQELGLTAENVVRRAKQLLA